MASTFEALAFAFPYSGPDFGPDGPDVVGVSVGFTGAARGRLVLKLSKPVVDSVVANMVGEASSALAVDAVGELANVICGNVLPALAGEDAICELARPVAAPATVDAAWPLSQARLSLDDGVAQALLYLDE